jgi:hypothetical protein
VNTEFPPPLKLILLEANVNFALVFKVFGKKLLFSGVQLVEPARPDVAGFSKSNCG